MASTSALHKAFRIDLSEHGGYDKPLDTSTGANLEVISLGLPRTGTTSLAAALEILGIGPVYQPVDLVRQPRLLDAWIDVCRNVRDGKWKAGEPALNTRIRQLFAGYRAATDNPPNLMGKEIYGAYPNAKYILGLRRSSEPDCDGISASAHAWWTSIWNSARPSVSKGWDRTIYCWLTYPVRWMRNIDRKVQMCMGIQKNTLGVEFGPSTYDKHRDFVRSMIPKEQLLEFDVKEGWEPLCKFLDVPVPKEPFPWKNEREKMQAMWVAFQMYGLFVWCAYLVPVVGATYLALLRPDVGRSLVNRAVEWCSHLFARLR